MFQYTVDKHEKVSVAGIQLDQGQASVDTDYIQIKRPDENEPRFLKIKSLKVEKTTVECVDKSRPFGAVVDEADFEFREGDHVKIVSRKEVPGKPDWEFSE